MRKLAIILASAAAASGIYLAASKSEPDVIVFGKGDQLLVELIEDNGERRSTTEWRRNIDCSSNAEEMKPGYGEVVSLLAHKEGNFLMEDYDCDGRVEWYSEFSKGEYARNAENEAQFEKADRLFREGKQEIRKYVDLDKILADWLKEKKK